MTNSETKSLDAPVPAEHNTGTGIPVAAVTYRVLNTPTHSLTDCNRSGTGPSRWQAAQSSRNTSTKLPIVLICVKRLNLVRVSLPTYTMKTMESPLGSKNRPGRLVRHKLLCYGHSLLNHTQLPGYQKRRCPAAQVLSLAL